jgi:hypothetical protein
VIGFVCISLATVACVYPIRECSYQRSMHSIHPPPSTLVLVSVLKTSSGRRPAAWLLRSLHPSCTDDDDDDDDD